MTLIQFDIGSGERIGNVVRFVENQANRLSPLDYSAAVEQQGGRSRLFRIATFTGSWAIGSSKVVTFKNQTATPNTASVTNLFCPLNPTGSCDVSIAKDGTTWFLVQPNLTQLPGYSASGTQVLSVISGNLRFIGTTAC